MTFTETLILLLGGIAASAVIVSLWAFAAEKTIDALGWRGRSKLDAARRADLRDLIEEAESKGVYVPESLRSSTT